MIRSLFSRLLIPSLMLFCGLHALALDSTYEVIATEISPDNEYRVFMQDKIGFIWLGTDMGIDVYDSNGRSAFDPSLATLRNLKGLAVTALLESGENIWIGSDRGLYYYSKPGNKAEKFNVKTKYGVTIGSKVSSILEGSDGNLWIATEGQGLFIYDPSNGSLTQDSRHGSFYSGLTLGADGLIYAVTITGTLQSFRPNGTLTKEYTLPGYQNTKSQIYLAASGKDIWMASGNRLFRVNVSNGDVAQAATPGLKGSINTLMARQDGTLLLSTAYGIWQYRPVNGAFSEIRPRRHFPGVHDPVIAAIAEMQDGNLAIAHSSTPLEVMLLKPGAIGFVPMPDGSLVRMQNAIDRVYTQLLKEYAGCRQLWDLEAVRRWGKAPATEKQLAIIQRRCKSFDTTGLSKGDASQILNRLFNAPKKRKRR